MASLTNESINLTGGCFCTAITYTLAIPALALRPTVIRRSKPQILPYTCLDHCKSCRHTAGVLVQSWLECPQSWGTFKLQLRPSSSLTSGPPSSETRFETFAAKDIVNPSKHLVEKTFLGCFESSPHVRRMFCARCATHLTFFDLPREKEEGEVTMDLTMGSLDEESLRMDGLRPMSRGLFWDEGVGWVGEVLNMAGEDKKE